MDVEMTRSGETDVLKLKGSWTIERANELKRVLLEMLNSCEHMSIDLEELTDVDLSTMQLILLRPSDILERRQTARTARAKIAELKTGSARGRVRANSRLS